MNKTHANIIFVDIRGFTAWANQVDTVFVLEEFLTVFSDILLKNFASTQMKRLGDGAMLVQVCPSPPHTSALEEMFGTLLASIMIVEQRFANLCAQVETRYGHITQLQLGWGVTRGMIQNIFQTDFIGANVNEAARLCNLARPCGIVVDRHDFPRLPLLVGTPWAFREWTHMLRGYTRETHLWISNQVQISSTS